MAITIDNLLNTAEAAEYLGVSQRAIYNWLEDGRITAVILGNIQFLMREDLDTIKFRKNKRRVERNKTKINGGIDGDHGAKPTAGNPQTVS